MPRAGEQTINVPVCPGLQQFTTASHGGALRARRAYASRALRARGERASRAVKQRNPQIFRRLRRAERDSEPSATVAHTWVPCVASSLLQPGRQTTRWTMGTRAKMISSGLNTTPHLYLRSHNLVTEKLNDIQPHVVARVPWHTDSLSLP